MTEHDNPLVDGSPLAAAYSRSGQFVFVGSLTPHDPVTGSVVTEISDAPSSVKTALRGALLTDAPMERSLAQTWRIYEHLRQILEANGAGLDDVLRQRIFIRDLRDLPVVEAYAGELFAGNLPATTIVQTPNRGVDPRINIMMDAIALAPEGGSLSKEIVRIQELDGATRGYPQATRAGQFAFFSNVAGVNPETGSLAVSLAELGDDAARFAGYWFRSRREEQILAQTWFIYQHLGEVMRSLGGTLHDLIKVNGWLTYMMRDCEPMVVARESLYSDAQQMPASCSIGISAVPWDDAVESYEAIGLIPSTGGIEKEIKYEPSGLSPLTVAVVRAGSHVYTCGEVPVSVPRRQSVTRFTDFQDAGRLLAWGRIHEESDIQARAWYVYNEQRDYLATHDATFADVVHQTVYMCKPEQYPSLERVASLFFGGQMPPTTLIPITDTSPFPEAELEIEMIAVTG